MATQYMRKGEVSRIVRKLGDKVVKTCLYNGASCGHGKYFAAMIDDQLVLDEMGKPVPYRKCGALVRG